MKDLILLETLLDFEDFLLDDIDEVNFDLYLLIAASFSASGKWP
jgi:hypothetical protein